MNGHPSAERLFPEGLKPLWPSVSGLVNGASEARGRSPTLDKATTQATMANPVGTNLGDLKCLTYLLANVKVGIFKISKGNYLVAQSAKSLP